MAYHKKPMLIGDSTWWVILMVRSRMPEISASISGWAAYFSWGQGAGDLNLWDRDPKYPEVYPDSVSIFPTRPYERGSKGVTTSTE